MASPARAAAQDLVGRVIGGYRVEARLGQGGMGAVYSAVNPDIGQRAAVKVLHPDLSDDAEFSRRFVNEARALSRVAHPGLVRIFDFGLLEDGTAYMLMELLEGETLRERVKRAGGRLPPGEVRLIGQRLAEALAAAHEQGIVHRDLKPDNVFLIPEVRLLDFGIAKHTGPADPTGVETELHTRTGMMMGTPRYMAPEQCREAGDVTPQADVYSLGVALYEMLAGRPPFAGTAGELIVQHMTTLATPLDQIDASLPPGLATLIWRMLAKSAAARPTMAEVGLLLSEGEILATPGPLKRALRGPVLPLVLLFATALAVAYGGLALHDRLRGPRPTAGPALAPPLVAPAPTLAKAPAPAQAVTPHPATPLRSLRPQQRPRRPAKAAAAPTASPRLAPAAPAVPAPVPLPRSPDAPKPSPGESHRIFRP